MPMIPKDRLYYDRFTTPELQAAYQRAEDRSMRAVGEAYVADAFAMQEIAAVLVERDAAIPDSPEPTRFQGNI